MPPALDSIGPGKGMSCHTPLELIERIAEVYADFGRVSTFSATAYDTAWLSMVYQPDGSSSLLFPECFEYLLSTQEQDGSWAPYGTPFDGVLNTLAALLAMSVRKDKASNDTNDTDLDQRIKNATSSAQTLLNSWKVSDTIHVGFEVLVTGLLRQLGEHGIEFEFPGRSALARLHAQKMQRFRPKMIYAEYQTTILHSLEALSGEIDFDKVSHHCTEETGILGSPAATAAYLINASQWDSRAAKYLASAISAYGGSGKVPSAFPTPVFELSWALSSLIPRIGSSETLDAAVLEKFATFFENIVDTQGGLAGFAPGLLPDADDTARVLMTLQLLGKPANLSPMIQHFQTDDHFKTYQLERNPSFSANCNVLLALLQTENFEQDAPQIESTLTYLLHKWEVGEVSDKWNIAHQYPALLLSEALISVLKHYDAEKLHVLPADLVLRRIPLTICQILLQTMKDQQEDGSWDGSLEKTSYSVRTIAQCLCLPWNVAIQATLTQSFIKGRSFISTNYSQIESNHFLWVEKTTYQTKLLKIAYCALAIHTPPDEHTWTPTVSKSFFVHKEKSKKMGGLLMLLPIFSHAPFASVDLVLLEASHFDQDLRNQRHSIMERDAIPMSQDKYLDIITVIWVACNHMAHHVLSSDIIRDMCVVSMLIYQMDELAESVIADWSTSYVKRLISILKQEAGMTGHSTLSNGIEEPHENGDSPRKRRKLRTDSVSNGDHRDESDEDPSTLTLVLEACRKLVAHVCEHPAVLRAPSSVQEQLTTEVYNFILGHIAHITDNRTQRLRKSPTAQSNGDVSADSVLSDYYKWVHTTASDDTSCPFAFQYMACLISATGSYCFQGPQALYYSRAVSYHLSALCRQYNDFGSARRDRAEGNVNSLDFQEFNGHYTTGHITDDANTPLGSNGATNGHSSALDAEKIEDEQKADLMAIAEFERASMELAFKQLGAVVEDVQVMRKMKAFVDVTDTFGQIYVQKDFSSRKTK